MASLNCPNHKIERVDWEYVCKECGAMEDYPVFVTQWRNVVPRDHITYKPLEYVTKKLEKLVGVYPMEFHDSVLVTSTGDTFVDDRAVVHEAISACGTWREVYTTLTRMNRERDYLKVSKFMGYGPELTQWLIKACMTVVYGPYKVQLLYVLYKTYQLYGLDPRVVPLRAVAGTLRKADDEWKKVCWDLGLPLLPTPEQLATPWS